MFIVTAWCSSRSRMGVAMTHPSGGPDLALRCDPDRARAAAGFDYFSIGVPGHDPIEALATHLTERGVLHDGVHRTPVGWVLLGVHDPDGHEVRFYTVPLELPDEAFLQAYGVAVKTSRIEFSLRRIGQPRTIILDVK